MKTSRGFFRHRGVAAACLVLAGTLTLNACSYFQAPVAVAPADAVPADTTGLLQAVSLNVKTDGTVAGVDSTNVFTVENSAETKTFNLSHSPAEVVHDLPVRVLTAYRTAEKTGTDLHDLAGYTGQAEIRLTIENLTQKAKKLDYDVAGSSHTVTGLVAAPLTVVAAAKLTGVDASKIVVASPGSEQTATNGVVSQSGKDSTVQWATILAPPRLKASTTLSLVVDAENFEVPDFDITVQPGISTDVSTSNIATSVLSGGSSNELDLLSRTISLISDVNSVLGQASETITKVATDLNSTADTLGMKTIADLKESATTMSASMKALGGEAESLGNDLSASLSSTKSLLLSQLSQQATAMNALLGDTNTSPAVATLTGSGCSAQVSPSANQSSVYSSLMQIVGQLNAYSGANQACKSEIQESLRTLVGPVAPTDGICADSTSLTCSILGTKNSINKVVADLVTAGQAAVSAVPAQEMSDVTNGMTGVDTDMGGVAGDVSHVSTAFNGLSAAIGDLSTEIATLASIAGTGNFTLSLALLEGSLNTTENAVSAAKAAFDTVKKTVAELKTTIRDLTSQLEDVNTVATPLPAKVAGLSDGSKNMASDIEDLIAEVQSLVATSKLTDKQGDSLLDPLNSLKTSLENQAADLTGFSGDLDDIVDGSKVSSNVSQALDNADTALNKLDTAFNDIDIALVALDTAFANIVNANKDFSKVNVDLAYLISASKQVNDKAATVVTYNNNLNAAITALATKTGSLSTSTNGLSTKIGILETQLGTLTSQIDNAFSSAATSATTQAETATNKMITNVNSQLTSGIGVLDAKFAEFSKGLDGAATAITTNGSKVVNGQKDLIAAIEFKTKQSISKQLADDLAQINQSVSASTKNLDATNALLSDDLKQVLLDLGDRDSRTGLLGAIGTGAAAADSANSQVALGSQTAAAYANVRGKDVTGIRLREAQTQASIQAHADSKPFRVTLPTGANHRTVYTIHLSEGNK